MKWLLEIRHWIGHSISSWFRPKTLGERGEAAAARFLRKLGYTIIVCGSRVSQRHTSPLGEIDIIAVQGRTIVFVEVKTRQSVLSGHPADAVDLQKQKRLTKLALAYLRRHDLLEHSSRFDVIAILWPSNARQPEKIEHFINAFEAVGNDGAFS